MEINGIHIAINLRVSLITISAIFLFLMIKLFLSTVNSLNAIHQADKENEMDYSRKKNTTFIHIILF